MDLADYEPAVVGAAVRRQRVEEVALGRELGDEEEPFQWRGVNAAARARRLRPREGSGFDRRPAHEWRRRVLLRERRRLRAELRVEEVERLLVDRFVAVVEEICL